MSGSSLLANGLIRVHKLITRALSVSVVKCDEYISKKGIPRKEKKGFLMYVGTLVKVMNAHHMSEDEIVFPYIFGRIIAPYDRLKNDHVAMAFMLDRLEKNTTKFSNNILPEVRHILSDLQHLWISHIKSEEASFSAKNMESLVENEQKSLMDKIQEHGAIHSGPGPVTIPFFLYNLEAKDRKEVMDEFPWILRYFLVPLVWRWKWKPMNPFLLN